MLLQKRIQTLSQVAEHREIVIAELNATLQEPPVRSNQKLEVGQKSNYLTIVNYSSQIISLIIHTNLAANHVL